MAAGEPHRRLAQPPDADRARTGSARAPDRPYRARLRAIARCSRGVPDVCRQNRRHADGPVALHAAPRRCSGRTLAADDQTRRDLSRAGRANSITRRGRLSRHRGRNRSRPWRCARRDSRLPRSSIGCAIPIRSTPSISCGCDRSIRSMPNPARRRAALSSTPPSANSRKPSARACPPIQSANCWRSAANILPSSRIIPRRARSGGRDFERIARWFVNWEIERRGGVAAIDAEINGEHEIKLEEGSFRLRGIADRIELRQRRPLHHLRL